MKIADTNKIKGHLSKVPTLKKKLDTDVKKTNLSSRRMISYETTFLRVKEFPINLMIIQNKNDKRHKANLF